MTNRSKQKTPSAPTIERRGVVIVGAGLAGLFTALKLAPIPVTLVSGAKLGEGASSVWAQAGIAAALAEGDSPEAHAADTISAGAGIVDESVALTMAREARSGSRICSATAFRSTRTWRAVSTWRRRLRTARAAFFTSKAILPAAPSWRR